MAGDDRDVLDDDMARVLRGMTGAERLKIANGMFNSAGRMIGSHLAAEHPDWDQECIEQETAQRISHGVAADSGWGQFFDDPSLVLPPEFEPGDDPPPDDLL